MTTNFKPLLAHTIEDISKVKLPVLVSPKLDGIRAITMNGQVYSRNLKPIANRHIQKVLAGLPNNLDGELIVGEPTGDKVFQRTSSGVMSEDGEPKFKFFVFDYFHYPMCHFWERHQIAGTMIKGHPFAELVEHDRADDLKKLAALEDEFVELGFEGAMVRSYDGVYKFGRSTMRQGILGKLKRWQDNEFLIKGVVEQMHNGNEATKDELGRTKRSTAKEGKTGKNTLGALKVTDGEVEFEVGSGFDDVARKRYWKVPPIGLYAKVKFQGRTPDGSYRFPIFQGIRDARDM